MEPPVSLPVLSVESSRVLSGCESCIVHGTGSICEVHVKPMSLPHNMELFLCFCAESFLCVDAGEQVICSIAPITQKQHDYISWVE